MSSSTVPSPGADVQILKAKGDYRKWAKEFQIACQSRGIWDLFTTKDKIEEPNEKYWERQIRSASSKTPRGMEVAMSRLAVASTGVELEACKEGRLRHSGHTGNPGAESTSSTSCAIRVGGKQSGR